MQMVEVFKTNIIHQQEARHVVELLLSVFPAFRINIDLMDCDNILRVEGLQVKADKIIELVSARGYLCDVLD